MGLRCLRILIDSQRVFLEAIFFFIRSPFLFFCNLWKAGSTKNLLNLYLWATIFEVRQLKHLTFLQLRHWSHLLQIQTFETMINNKLQHIQILWCCRLQKKAQSSIYNKGRIQKKKKAFHKFNDFIKYKNSLTFSSHFSQTNLIIFFYVKEKKLLIVMYIKYNKMKK